MMQVKKRSGMLVDFNPQKIVNAVNKALKAAKVTDSEVGQNIADSILKNKKDQISIEEIHDAVETGLMAAEFHEAAKRYILYRHDKKQKLFKEREEKKESSKHYWTARPSVRKIQCKRCQIVGV